MRHANKSQLKTCHHFIDVTSIFVRNYSK